MYHWFFYSKKFIFLKSFVSLFKILYIKCGMLCPLILTQISVSRFVELFLLIRSNFFYCETGKKFVRNSNFNRNDVRTNISHSVLNLMSMSYRRYVDHGSTLLHRNIDMHLSHTHTHTHTHTM